MCLAFTMYADTGTFRASSGFPEFVQVPRGHSVARFRIATILCCLCMCSSLGSVICGSGWYFEYQRRIRVEREASSADRIRADDQQIGVESEFDRNLFGLEWPEQGGGASVDLAARARTVSAPFSVTLETCEAPDGEDCVPPSSAWRKLIFRDMLSLKNRPLVVKTAEDAEGVAVTVINNGSTILEYMARGESQIQQFQEIRENGEWRRAAWNWCGTGMSEREIAPGEAVDLRIDFWDPVARERILGAFKEKFTINIGLVVLATEAERR